MGTPESEIRDAWDRARPGFETAADRIRMITPAQWLLIGAASFLILFPFHLILRLALLASVLVAVLMWIHEFVTLMRSPGSAFPGKHDRLVWVLLMTLAPPIGAVAFWTFRRSHWPDGVPVETAGTAKSRQPWSEDDHL